MYTMLDWLAQGPLGAVVRGTEVSAVEPTGERGFRITF